MTSGLDKIELTEGQAYALAEIAALYTDLDDACRAVQMMIEQDDGGIAAIFFSGKEGDDWKTADEARRGDLLERYLKTELMMRLDD
jgi:hypothetical protein